MIQNLPNFIERGKDIELIIIVHSFLKAQNRFYLFQPIPYCITVLKEHLCCQGNISVAFYISKYCFQQIGMMTFVVFGEQSFNIIVKLLYPSVVAQSAKKLVNSDLAEIKQRFLADDGSSAGVYALPNARRQGIERFARSTDSNSKIHPL